ncbi:MAG: PH domain-containing protein [Planctomycetia bacterium]|nr:MAG: PH domain-containing protein [Planctomycetia bacterium]
MAPIVAPDKLAIPVAAPHVLDGGEVVELSIRPSPWFIAFVSARVVLAAAIAGLLFLSAGAPVFGSAALPAAVTCFGGACARLAFGALQWAATIYMLTNRRAIRLRGVLSVEVSELPLVRVADVALLWGVHQRMVRVGTVMLRAEGAEASLPWEHVSSPADIYQRVVRAVRRQRQG